MITVSTTFPKYRYRYKRTVRLLGGKDKNENEYEIKIISLYMHVVCECFFLVLGRGSVGYYGADLLK